MDGERGPQSQRAARAAVLAVPLFPDLERMLVAAFGPACGIFTHQLCYWFSRPKYAAGKSPYITSKDIYEQRGLRRRAHDRARREGTSKYGIFTELRGAHNHIYYDMDWVCIAARLNLKFILHNANAENPLSPSGKQAKQGGQVNLPAVGEQVEVDRLGEQVKLSTVGERAHTEDYAGDLEQETTQEIPLTGGADDSSSRPAPQQDEDEHIVASHDFSPAPPSGTQKFDPSKDRKYRDVRDLVLNPEREVHEIALRVIHQGEEEDREKLVGAVGRALGDPLGGMTYRARITQAVGELEELELAGKAS